MKLILFVESLINLVRDKLGPSSLDVAKSTIDCFFLLISSCPVLSFLIFVLLYFFSSRVETFLLFIFMGSFNLDNFVFFLFVLSIILVSSFSDDVKFLSMSRLFEIWRLSLLLVIDEFLRLDFIIKLSDSSSDDVKSFILSKFDLICFTSFFLLIFVFLIVLV